MDSTVPEEIEKRYHVARLNLEKSERAAGHLARFLGRQAIASRLFKIAAERCEVGGRLQLEAFEPAGAAGFAVRPIPNEVGEALREMRAWRVATLEAYEQLPAAKRAKMPRQI